MSGDVNGFSEVEKSHIADTDNVEHHNDTHFSVEETSVRSVGEDEDRAEVLTVEYSLPEKVQSPDDVGEEENQANLLSVEYSLPEKLQSPDDEQNNRSEIVDSPVVDDVISSETAEGNESLPTVKQDLQDSDILVAHQKENIEDENEPVDRREHVDQHEPVDVHTGQHSAVDDVNHFNHNEEAGDAVTEKSPQNGVIENGGNVNEEKDGGPGELLRQESTGGMDEILQSPAFRRELDEIIGDQLKSAPAANDLLALQQISDYLLPKGHGMSTGNIGKGTVIPIADTHDADGANYLDGEKSLRSKVAAVYRLVDLFNWTRGFNSLITCRISQEFEYFLVVPHGMLYSEVTAASLVRVDRQGDVLDPGTTNMGINQVAFKLHAALHASRPDLKCIIHLRNPTAVSVSVMNCGLLPLCPEAMELGETSNYNFPGVITDDAEVGKLIRAFGPSNRVLLLRNFGILVGGSCVEDAFHSADSVMIACETQLRMLPLGLKNLKLPTTEEKRKVYEERNAKVPEGKRKFTKGILEFEELMTLLDNAGYRTGYPYHPTLPIDEDGYLQDHEIAVPPSATSFDHREDRSRSKEKKPKAVSKDAETVPTTPRSKPTVLRTPQVINVQQLKERYREIRKQYYDNIGPRRDTARQSKPRSLSRNRKIREEIVKEKNVASSPGPASPKPVETPKTTSKTSPIHAEDKAISSPTKSTSSGEGAIDERKSPQATPSKDVGDSEKAEKKKKKGFLSFGKKDKEKKSKDK